MTGENVTEAAEQSEPQPAKVETDNIHILDTPTAVYLQAVALLPASPYRSELGRLQPVQLLRDLLDIHAPPAPDPRDPSGIAPSDARLPAAEF
ncbi:hypothetical protein [Streptomyces sp. NPDC048266]|uniref:hypothetical protein n=1 Tax=Streptomyces sp. NPDC048266 TaxID=3155787 RepID=UPI0033EF4236